jgi:cytochrome c biogenesis protein CcdA
MGLSRRKWFAALGQPRLRRPGKSPKRGWVARRVRLPVELRRDRRLIALRVMAALAGLALVVLTLLFTLLMIGTVVHAAADDIANLWGLAIAIPGLVGVGGLWLVADRRLFAQLRRDSYRRR